MSWVYDQCTGQVTQSCAGLGHSSVCTRLDLRTNLLLVFSSYRSGLLTTLKGRFYDFLKFHALGITLNSSDSNLCAVVCSGFLIWEVWRRPPYWINCKDKMSNSKRRWSVVSAWHTVGSVNNTCYFHNQMVSSQDAGLHVSFILCS